MKDSHTKGLFDEPDGRLEFPRARASDPITSHEAADRVTDSGLAHTQRAAILAKCGSSPAVPHQR